MSAGHTHPVIEHKGLQTVGGAELWLTVSDVGLKKGGGAANRAVSFNKCATEPRLKKKSGDYSLYFVPLRSFCCIFSKRKINQPLWVLAAFWHVKFTESYWVRTGNNVSPEGHAVLDKMREGQRICLIISAIWNVFELTFAVRTQYAAIQFWRAFPLFPEIKSL